MDNTWPARSARPDPAARWRPRSLLRRLDDRTRDALLELGIARSYGDGDILMLEGSAGGLAVLIETGFVKVTVSNGDSSALLAVRAPGDLVGELAVISGGTRNATLTACGSVTARVVPRDTFLAFMGQHPAVFGLLTSIVGDRLAFSNRRRAEFGTHTVFTRLAVVIHDLGTTCGEPTADGGIHVHIPISQSELASMVGASDASVSNALRRLRIQGLLETRYRGLKILDPAGLLAACSAPDVP
ncbi:Crp/Fnr family transcriptional regulator [Longispora sp. NPDC051575]|uniref:Crp/Fnr family transcriptional regulator n=1 Tax=Longispora sp. NPDC051575 TaxID=3154943 RepID=UPI0034319C47